MGRQWKAIAFGVGIAATVTSIVWLWRWTFHLPGGPDIQPGPDDREILTRADMEREFPNRHDLDFAFRIFAEGVRQQHQGHDAAAAFYYRQLCSLRRSDGQSFDLSQYSRVLRHNMRLLRD